MSAVALNSSDLAASVAGGNTMATAIWGTVTGNAGWWILIATAGIIVGLAYFLLRRLRRLGRG